MIAYDRLSVIIPSDQALACKALSVSLQQIAGISTMLLPELANAVIPQQTTRDLPLISALTVAVPPDVANYFSSTSAVGSGPSNSIVVCDVIGTAGGFVSAGAMANTISNLANVNVVSLTSTYSTMANVVDGTYGDPTEGPVIIPTGPYANTYINAEEAFANALIPGAQSQIGTVILSYPSQTGNLNTNWNNMAAQLTREKSLQAQAGINYANLQPNSTASMYGFIYSIPAYGLGNQVGGICQLVESVADYTSFTGQAVIASLREGRNRVALQSVGITTNADIPADPNPPAPTANLIPSTYSAQQAANLIVV
jgi:hypothetical protein